MKIKYTTMIVKDMDESVSFYRDVIGFEVDSQHNPAPDIVITLLKGEGDTMIELIKDPQHDIGLYSIGMDVEDVEAIVEELISKGANITMDPVPITVGKLAFMEDPNGVKIALIQHH
ncbi:Glyoxalase/bleomycin resistance protein/dioxygenase [Methanobacterium lacus]|uniref:Glyoxalase/bleomycin resistance protein/dioxygenase n=1 Tax=Methanobacterium lacus (strain AL-21) TaxID=877455 RepID=F0T6Q1_METLA|nr:VOC family protein [Methanobacterium lacus]ADZ08284.1 Glyoxalase/bleomycin resistance protein/dioxygenase [Methanobacterium lacus]